MVPVTCSRSRLRARVCARRMRRTTHTYRASKKRLLRCPAVKLACLAFSITFNNISGRLRAQRCFIISL